MGSRAEQNRWDLETDVICVGSGIGALSAAIAAHDEQQEVIILEKAAKLGGVTAYSFGEVWVPDNHVETDAGLQDSRDLSLCYLDFLAGGFADPELQAVFLDKSSVACRYFGEKAGVPWKICKDFPDYHYPTVPGSIAQGRFLEVEPIRGSELGEWQHLTRLAPSVPNGITHDEMFGWGGAAALLDWDFRTLASRRRDDFRAMGPGLAAAFVRASVVDREIKAYTETPVRELVVDSGGAVIGVRAERNGRDFFVRARHGVVLAISGYDHRPDIARYFEQTTEWHSACPPGIDGDHFTFAAEIGAEIAAVPPLNMAVLLGYQIPGEEADGIPLWRLTFESGFPHTIFVNRAGKRFGDESFYRDWQPKLHQWDGLRQEYSNYPPFMIFDQTFRDKYPLGPFAPGQPLPDELVVQAETVKELADKLGVDADGLTETVARFNGFAASGTDDDFGRGSYPWANFMCGDLRQKPNPNLGPVEKPPFYGLRLSMVSAGINAAGLRVNPNAQVMHVRGHPIPGLYAAGNSVAYLDIGAGYQSGFANTRGMVWGYVAGKHCAQLA